jgi:hypothetical protein
VHASALVFWRSFGVALLAALRQSRERQAAREIEYHRQLIEGARSYKLNRPEPRPQSGGMVVKIAIVATSRFLDCSISSVVPCRSDRLGAKPRPSSCREIEAILPRDR